MHTSSPATPLDTEYQPTATVRHVRVKVPERLYRKLRHRLVDVGPTTSISDLVVELIELGLGQS